MIHYGPCSEISMKWKILHFKVMFVKTDHLIEYLLCYVCKDLKPAFRIHLIFKSIQIWIRGSTFGKSGSESSDPPFRNSGSGSSDPHLEKVDPDPRKEIEVDPDPDVDPKR